MARQRLVKPEFFQHEELHRAEVVSALPLRLAYIGLWCQVDRRGLFEWKPGRLKLNILPFDTTDFSAVLDALERFGFIVSYVVDGQRYGLIPKFHKHQTFHIAERADKNIPDPPPDLSERKEHGAGTVPTPEPPSVSTPVTVTVTGSVAGAGSVAAPDNNLPKREKKPRVSAPKKREPAPTPNWVSTFGDWWADHVGAVNFGRIGKDLKATHAARGLDALLAGAAVYNDPVEGPPRKSYQDFAANAVFWIDLAAMPMVDADGRETLRCTRIPTKPRFA